MKYSLHRPHVIPIVCLMVSLAACNVGLPAPPTAAPPASPLPLPTRDANLTALVDALGRDFAEKRVIEVYERVSPSVVNVTTQVLRRSFFFEVIPEEGAGSGFVLDEAGYIVTNFHVIDGAQSIEVTFNDETTRPAQVVGADPRNDIAVLKVEAPAHLLRPVELGDSSNLKVGQRAVVIGNPFGQFGGTLTTGVISALDRSLQGQDGRQITGIIQTDAAINQGNSGGPLLDSAGRVIGINTAIFSPSGTNAGVGFAVPVDTLRRVLPDLLTLGRYRHPWLGVRFGYRLSPGLQALLELPVDQGVLLVELYPQGPLARGGLRGARQEIIAGNQRVFVGGDIITAIDEQPVTSLEQLQILLETDYKVGDTVQVTFIRDGREQIIAVELVEEPGR